MKKGKNILVFRFLIGVILVLGNGWYSQSNAQYYIWGSSKNYDILRNDSAYCYIYKSESIYQPTQIYYEMCVKRSFLEEVYICNFDYNNNPISFGTLYITIDGQDTVVFIDTLGTAQIRLSRTTQNFDIKTFTKPQGFHIPITDRYIPTKIKIVWGTLNDSASILTICSKVPLDDKKLTEISNTLFLGCPIDSDLFYYYFSDE